jgi:pimeloyl-ACP methyl ester carboxylesterase
LGLFSKFRTLQSTIPVVAITRLAGEQVKWGQSNRVASLGATHQLLFVDLLGFGHSPKPWTRYTMERHVAELRDVLAPQPRFTLVGHSFGAALAVAYAARYPEQVEGLVLFSLPYWVGRHRRSSSSDDRTHPQGGCSLMSFLRP